MNLVNLALTAWVLSMTRGSKRTQNRNSRRTRKIAATVNEVKSNTDGQLTRVLKMLEKNEEELATIHQRTAKGKPKPKPRTKPRPRGK